MKNHAEEGTPSPGDGKEGRSGNEGFFRSEEQTQRMLDILKGNPGRRFARFMKEGCVHCGLCADACHYYLSQADAEHIPANKSNLVYATGPRQSHSPKVTPSKEGMT